MKFTLRLLFASLLPFSIVFAGSATWNVNTISNDWNTPRNWMPRTVPDGPADTATFATSNVPNPVIHSSVEVNGIVFNAAFTQFTITAGDAASQDAVTLTLSGAGVTNTSTVLLQNLEAAPTLATSGATNVISFTNNATLTAVDGTFTHLLASGGDGVGSVGGQIQFHDNSSLASATTISNFALNGGGPGGTFFFDNSTAAEGEIVNLSFNGSSPGFTVFQDNSTAANAFIRNDPAIGDGLEGGKTFFLGFSTAGDSGIDAAGGISQGDTGAATVIFSDTATAGNAVLEGEGGTSIKNGGSIQFMADSTGGSAQVILLGFGRLIINDHNPPGITIGSIEGGGNVFLGSNELTVGSANLSKTYFGVIQDSGSLTKIGTGSLTLTGSNTYSGGTTIRRGRLVVNNMDGSGTGSGAIRVNAGILAGRGTIAGAVIVGTGSGTGAALAPGKAGGKTGTLTIQNTLTFQLDSTYNFELKTTVETADKVVANGVTINSGALFAFIGLGSGTLTPGTVFTAISNTAAMPITGTFANLSDGAIVTVNGNNFQADYEGGDGNDLTLTVVP